MINPMVSFQAASAVHTMNLSGFDSPEVPYQSVCSPLVTLAALSCSLKGIGD